MIPQAIALVVRAKALIQRLKKFIEFLGKVQDLWSMLGRSPAPPPAPRPAPSGPFIVGIKAHHKFVINPAGMRQLLQSEDIGRALEAAARAVAPPDLIVSRLVGRTRQNIRITDESWGAMDREAQTGHLTRLLGQIRI